MQRDSFKENGNPFCPWYSPYMFIKSGCLLFDSPPAFTATWKDWNYLAVQNYFLCFYRKFTDHNFYSFWKKLFAIPTSDFCVIYSDVCYNFSQISFFLFFFTSLILMAPVWNTLLADLLPDDHTLCLIVNSLSTVQIFSFNLFF